MAFINELPTEILQEILTEILDIISLRTLILTSRRFYKAFRNAEEYITTQVLLNHLNPTLLHDALISREASLRKSWSPKDVEELISRYLDQDSIYPSALKWTLSEALPIARLHNHIRFLTTDIASSALASRSQDLKDNPLSTGEVTRIQRMFYRYEIYCSLFREKNPPFYPGMEQTDVFFDHFAPWENEQLACIYDYFVTAIYSVLDELSTQDPDWASYFAIVGDPSETCIQYQLSLGLRRLGPLVAADSYEGRHRAIGKTSEQGFRVFLDEALENISPYESENILSEMDSEEEDDYVCAPFVKDDDSGPEDVWRWAHQLSTSQLFVFSDSHIPVRKWAYVMWDRWRLDSWGVFDRPWEKPEPGQEGKINEWASESTFKFRAQMMVREGRLSPAIDYM